jgi:hypothetical protein
LIGIHPSLGKGLTESAIDGGRLLLCANLPGNNVALFRIDPQTGGLTSVSRFRSRVPPASCPLSNGGPAWRSASDTPRRPPKQLRTRRGALRRDHRQDEPRAAAGVVIHGLTPNFCHSIHSGLMTGVLVAVKAGEVTAGNLEPDPVPALKTLLVSTGRSCTRRSYQVRSGSVVAGSVEPRAHDAFAQVNGLPADRRHECGRSPYGAGRRV